MNTVTRLGEYLTQAKLISNAQLEAALQRQQHTGELLGQILLEMGSISDLQLCQAISETLKVQWVTIEHILITDDTIALVPESLAASCKILPLFFHGKTLYLAMQNPRDTGVIQLVEFTTGMVVKPLIVPQDQLYEMLCQYYQLDAAMLTELNLHAKSNALPPSPTPMEIARLSEHLKGLPEFRRKRMGEILVDAALINQTQLDQALHIQRESQGWLGQILVEHGWVTEEEICQAMSASLHVPYIKNVHIKILPEVIALVPESLAASCNIVPLAIKQEILHLAMENPLDTGAVQLVEYSTGKHVKPVIASPGQLEYLLRRYYSGTPISAARRMKR